MKKGLSIKIQQENIAELQTNYETAIKLLQELKENLNTIHSSFGTSYQGLADDVEAECIAKYIEHIDFLEMCCSSNKDFISNATESITAMDAKISETFKRGC